MSMLGNNVYQRRLARLLGEKYDSMLGGAGAANSGGPKTEEAATAEPRSDGRPQRPGAPPPLFYRGKGSGAAGTRRRLMQLNLRNAFAAQGPLWDSIYTLMDQANTNHFSPEARAQFLAPRLEAINQTENMALGNLTRSLLSRGLDESSHAAAREGALLGQGVGNRASTINSLAAAEQTRQTQSQALLRDLLMSLQNKGSQQASSIADSITNFQLKQAELDAKNSFGIGDFFAALGGIGGAAARLGWQPFSLKTPAGPR